MRALRQGNFPGERGTCSFHADAVILSMGGGGLFCGIVQGLEGLDSHTCVVAAETLGIDLPSQSLGQVQNVTLGDSTSINTSLGVRRVRERACEYAIDDDRVSAVVLTDGQAVDACRRSADDERMLIDPACGVASAACYNSMLPRLVKGLRYEQPSDCCGLQCKQYVAEYYGKVCGCELRVVGGYIVFFDG